MAEMASDKIVTLYCQVTTQHQGTILQKYPQTPIYLHH